MVTRKLFLYFSFSYDSLTLAEQSVANLSVSFIDRFHSLNHDS